MPARGPRIVLLVMAHDVLRPRGGDDNHRYSSPGVGAGAVGPVPFATTHLAAIRRGIGEPACRRRDISGGARRHSWQLPPPTWPWVAPPILICRGLAAGLLGSSRRRT